jgi:hypothetical protein
MKAALAALPDVGSDRDFASERDRDLMATCFTASSQSRRVSSTARTRRAGMNRGDALGWGSSGWMRLPNGCGLLQHAAILRLALSGVTHGSGEVHAETEAMKSTLVLTAALMLASPIAQAGSVERDALTECVHSSKDSRYTYSFLVNECPTIGTVEIECAVSDNQRKTTVRSQRMYEPDMSSRPRWNRRCVVVDENGTHVFTRSENAFSVMRAADASAPPSARPAVVVDAAPCSQRAHAGKPRRLAALLPPPAWRW